LVAVSFKAWFAVVFVGNRRVQMLARASSDSARQPGHCDPPAMGAKNKASAPPELFRPMLGPVYYRCEQLPQGMFLMYGRPGMIRRYLGNWAAGVLKSLPWKQAPPWADQAGLGNLQCHDLG